MRDGSRYLFYSNTIVNNNDNSGGADANNNGVNDICGTITLDGGEANHAVSALRIKIGRQIQATDGNGVIYDCRCTEILKQSVSCVIVGEKRIQKITPALTLLIGLPDKERFEAVLEHATALGVSRIIPIAMDHCRKPWWESWEKQRQRFLSKMVVSMKQCLYPYLPQLDAPLPLNKAIEECGRMLIVADQHGRKIDDAEILPHKEISCLIGPPGGISDSESKLLESYTGSAIKVTLASTRLRTELAATILCARIIAAYL